MAGGTTTVVMIVMIVGTAAHGTVAIRVGAATGVGAVTPAGAGPITLDIAVAVPS